MNFQILCTLDQKNGICDIAALNSQTLDIVSERLEIVARKVTIPKKEMSRVIGSKGSTITKIKERVGNDDISIISWNRLPIEIDRLKERSNRKKQNKQNKQQANDVDEFTDDLNISEILKNVQIDDIFYSSDNVDLTNGNIKDGVDYLIIIGRRSRVELCITMIEVTLQHLRKSYEHKEKIKQLKKIN